MLTKSEIVLTMDNQQIRFRPTLRAAMRLERRFDGFQKILEGLRDQNLTVISAIVAECADDPENLLSFLSSGTHKPLAYRLGALIEPLIMITLQLAGIDDDLSSEKKTGQGAVSYPDYFTRLFKIATGWLGWTPAETWEATPAEIMAAYDGRVEMFRAIFGSKEEKAPAMTPDALSAFFRSRAA